MAAFCIECVHCSTPLNLPEEALGRRVRCPKCKGRFLVPKFRISASQEPPRSDAEIGSLSSAELPSSGPASRTHPGAVDTPGGRSGRGHHDQARTDRSDSDQDMHVLPDGDLREWVDERRARPPAPEWPTTGAGASTADPLDQLTRDPEPGHSANPDSSIFESVPPSREADASLFLTEAASRPRARAKSADPARRREPERHEPDPDLIVPHDAVIPSHRNGESFAPHLDFEERPGRMAPAPAGTTSHPDPSDPQAIADLFAQYDQDPDVDSDPDLVVPASESPSASGTSLDVFEEADLVPEDDDDLFKPRPPSKTNPAEKAPIILKGNKGAVLVADEHPGDLYAFEEDPQALPSRSQSGMAISVGLLGITALVVSVLGLFVSIWLWQTEGVGHLILVGISVYGIYASIAFLRGGGLRPFGIALTLAAMVVGYFLILRPVIDAIMPVQEADADLPPVILEPAPGDVDAPPVPGTLPEGAAGSVSESFDTASVVTGIALLLGYAGLMVWLNSPHCRRIYHGRSRSGDLEDW